VALVKDLRTGRVRMFFGDTNSVDVPIGEHLEQIKHFHPRLGRTVDLGVRTPSWDDIDILKQTFDLRSQKGVERSMFEWYDVGGKKHFTVYRIIPDGGAGTLRVTVPGEEPFMVSLGDRSAQQKFNLWVGIINQLDTP
jgi:hypothetical protein